MDILKDGKINTELIKPGDFIQILDKSKINGIVVIVDENEIFAKVLMNYVLMLWTITWDEIQDQSAKFIISNELSGATIRVNMPADPINTFVSSLDWGESKEDRRNW